MIESMLETGFSIKQYNQPWHTYRSKEYVKVHVAIEMNWRAIRKIVEEEYF